MVDGDSITKISLAAGGTGVVVIALNALQMMVKDYFGRRRNGNGTADHINGLLPVLVDMAEKQGKTATGLEALNSKTDEGNAILRDMLAEQRAQRRE